MVRVDMRVFFEMLVLVLIQDAAHAPALDFRLWRERLRAVVRVVRGVSVMMRRLGNGRAR